MTIKIGTRKSRLALAQTEMLIKTLKNRFPNVKIETVYISTTGDKTLDKPLAALGGKGVFIKELEMSLLSGETDVAVHSAKDLTGAGCACILCRSRLRCGRFRGFGAFLALHLGFLLEFPGIAAF